MRIPETIKSYVLKLWSIGSKVTTTQVVAGATVAYLITTVGILCQMQSDNRIQRDYYQKTVRPFVYFEDIKLEDFKKTIQDTILSIKYYLKNVGALPATKVHTITLWDSTINEEFKTWAYKKLALKLAFLSHGSSIFPNQVVDTLADRTTKHSTFLLSYIEKRPYLHTYLVYEDTGGRLYFNKAISKIQTSIEDGQIKWNILNIWVEFD